MTVFTTALPPVSVCLSLLSRIIPVQALPIVFLLRSTLTQDQKLSVPHFLPTEIRERACSVMSYVQGVIQSGCYCIRVGQWRYFVRKLLSAPSCFQQLLSLLPGYFKACIKSGSNARKGRGGGGGDHIWLKSILILSSILVYQADSFLYIFSPKFYMHFLPTPATVPLAPIRRSFRKFQMILLVELNSVNIVIV
jgi:hypothetical protein